MLFEQADPWIPAKAGPAVFPAWRAAVAAAGKRWGKPMLFVHGDSHQYRFDRPFSGRRNLWRLIVPGDEDLAGVLVTVDPAAKRPFVMERIEVP